MTRVLYNQNSIFIFGLLQIFFFFIIAVVANTNNLEMFTKNAFNDSFINSYTYFWTNFIFIFIFFGWIWYFSLLEQYPLYHYFFACFFFLYTYELLNNLITVNESFSLLNTYIFELNPLLLNVLNKYHPFLFYLNLIFFFTILLSAQTRKVNRSLTYFFNITLLNQKINNTSHVIISIMMLFFGAWWAFQEATWGGWWNWDPSEFFGLIFFLNTAIFFHLKWTALKINIYKLNLQIISLVICIWYYFIQLNFDLTSHNFGLRSFFFFSNNFFFFEFFLLCFFFLLARIHISCRILSQFLVFVAYVNYRVKTFRFLNLNLQLLFVLYFLASNNMLLHFFIWKILNIKFFFYTNLIIFFNWNAIFIWIAFSYFIFKNISFYLGLLVCANLNFVWFFIFFSQQNWTLLSNTHFMLLNFLIQTSLNWNVENLFKTIVIWYYELDCSNFFFIKTLNFNLIENLQYSFQGTNSFNWHNSLFTSILRYAILGFKFELLFLLNLKTYIINATVFYYHLMQIFLFFLIFVGLLCIFKFSPISYTLRIQF